MTTLVLLVRVRCPPPTLEAFKVNSVWFVLCWREHLHQGGLVMSQAAGLSGHRGWRLACKLTICQPTSQVNAVRPASGGQASERSAWQISVYLTESESPSSDKR